MRPISSRRRIARLRAWVALTRSPCASRSRALPRAPSAASPELAQDRARSRPRRRRGWHGQIDLRTEGIPPALRSSVFARTRSPSCAIAMPRSASAGAHRRATQPGFRRQADHPPQAPAPRRGGDQRVHGNPARLSLPSFDNRHQSISRQSTKGMKGHDDTRDEGIPEKRPVAAAPRSSRLGLPRGGADLRRYGVAYRRSWRR